VVCEESTIVINANIAHYTEIQTIGVVQSAFLQ